MAKQTQKQRIAAQAAQIENLNLIALDSLRERDDAKAELETVKGQLNAVSLSPDDAKLHARLAAILFPDDDPTTLHADDLAHKCLRNSAEDARIAKWVKDTAMQLDESIDTDLSPEELAEAIHDAARDAAIAKKRLETRQEDAGGEDELDDLCHWHKNSGKTIEEWDRLAELVDLLGLSGNRLAFVLGASDMQSALRHYA
jgi:hypothetical protein